MPKQTGDLETDVPAHLFETDGSASFRYRIGICHRRFRWKLTSSSESEAIEGILNPGGVLKCDEKATCSYPAGEPIQGLRRVDRWGTPRHSTPSEAGGGKRDNGVDNGERFV